MSDIETMGTAPGSVIAALAGRLFFPGGQIWPDAPSFYMTIDEDSCKAVGLKTDPATVDWWHEPVRAEALAALKVNPRPLGEVLDAFSTWWSDNGCTRMWCQGPDFDLALITAAYRAAGRPVPWGKNHWLGRDTRGFYEVASLRPAKRVGVYHHALDDCDTQIADVQESLLRVGLDDERKPIITGWVAERRRQLAIGHTRRMDDTYTDGQLARAAAAHMLAAGHMEAGAIPAVAHGLSVGIWPWDAGTYQVSDAESSRAKAAALMLAEAERIARAQLRQRELDDALNCTRHPKFTLASGRPWSRDDESTFDVLCLVGEIEPDIPVRPEHEGTILAPLNRGRNVRVLTVADIATWSDDECRDAELWAGAIHLSASDNDDVEIPPMPAHLAPWTERKAS